MPAKPLPKKESWNTPGNIVAVVGAFVAAMTALATAILAIKSQKTIESTRVEIGSVGTNSNASDCDNPWRQWEGTPNYIGVQRTVRFAKPFQNSPKVATALSLIDVAPLDVALFRLGYKINDSDEEARLREPHILSFAVNVKPEAFVLEAGIGLPPLSAKYLVQHLSHDLVDQNLLEERWRVGGICHSGHSDQTITAEKLTSDETWMMNFYGKIGSIDVTWTAQAEQR